MMEVNLSALPHEVVAYGFDQLPDRSRGVELEEALSTVITRQSFERNYDARTLTIRQTVLGAVLESALDEKVNDIGWEVRHGERTDLDRGATSQFRSLISDAFDAEYVIDLSHLPDEVVAYGFDQLPDRLDIQAVQKEVSDLNVHDQFELDYEDETFRLNDTVIGSILRGALYEKIDDIGTEVRRGDRSDYDADDIDRMRREVRRAFEEPVAA